MALIRLDLPALNFPTTATRRRLLSCASADCHFSSESKPGDPYEAPSTRRRVTVSDSSGRTGFSLYSSTATATATASDEAICWTVIRKLSSSGGMPKTDMCRQETSSEVMNLDERGRGWPPTG